jgi:hypothetical protein
MGSHPFFMVSGTSKIIGFLLERLIYSREENFGQHCSIGLFMR